MSTPGLFIAGAVVTLIVATAVVLLLYAAILDGRDARARERGQLETRLTDPSHGVPSAAAR